MPEPAPSDATPAAPIDTAPPPAAPAQTPPPSASGPGATPPSAPAGGGPLALSDVDPPAPPPPAFAENWREVMSGGDAKKLEYLKRFGSPSNLFSAFLDTRRKVGSGEYLKARPEGKEDDPAFQESLNQWRAAIGVPAKPEGYLENLPKGLVVGDADKPMVESFLADMHKADAPPAYAHAALSWYYQHQEKVMADQAAADKAARLQNEDDLRQEWGAEYRGNINGIKSLFLSPDFGGDKALLEKFFGARFPDGRLVGDDPSTLRFLDRLAREFNPRGTVVPAGGGDIGKSIDAEMKSIEAKMGTPEYYKDEAMQARWRELHDLKAKRSERAA